MRNLLGRIKDFFTKTEIEIHVLDLRRKQVVNKEDLPHRVYSGVVVRSAKRKVFNVGSSKAVTIPEVEAEKISNDGLTEREFLLLDDDSQIIVFRKPQSERENKEEAQG